MTAVFTHFVFCLALWQFLFTPYGGECRSDPREAAILSNYKNHDSKLTKPNVVGGLEQASNSPSDDVSSNTTTPSALTDDDRSSAGTTASSKLSHTLTLSEEPLTIRNDYQSTATNRTHDKLENGFVVAKDAKIKATPLKLRTKKSEDGTPDENASKARPRRPSTLQQSTEGERLTSSTLRTDRTSRGKFKYHLDNAITESTKPKSSLSEGLTGHVSKLPLNTILTNDSASIPFATTLSEAMATTVRTATQVTVDSKKNENTTRSGKSSNFRVGGDGYVFEKTFDLDAVTESERETGEDFSYEPQESTYFVSESENNIDRIRNYNENAGNFRIGNIVKKPQGFTLTTETSIESGLQRKPSTSGISSTNMNGLGLKKRITNSVVSDSAPVISLTRPGPGVSGSSTENNPTSISKNEIVRKPSLKPAFNTRRRVNPIAEKSENSLPTTSAVWALAALKTPTNNLKVQKRPSGVEVVRKPVVENKVTHVPSTTIKPFVSWSTRLQKTTTEDLLDTTTTLRTPLEVDAETISPIALNDPKLMNMSEINVPELVEANVVKISNESKDHILIQAVTTNKVNAPENVTSVPATVAIVTEDDIRIDLVDNVDSGNVNKDSQLVGTKHLATDFSRFNYMTDGVVSLTNETRNPLIVIAGDNKTAFVNDEPARVSPELSSTTMMNILMNKTSTTVDIDEQKELPSLGSNDSHKVDHSTEMSSTPNLNVNNSIVVVNVQEVVKSTSDVIPSSLVENSESNVIFEQTYNETKEKKKNQDDRKREDGHSRNVTEEKHKIASLEDTIVPISSNNNSVNVDESRDTRTATVVISISEDESVEQVSQNTTSMVNATQATDFENEWKMQDAKIPPYSVNSDEVIPSTTSSSPIMKISPLDSEELFITTVKNLQPISQPASPSTSVATSSTPSSSPSTSQLPPTTWASDEEMSTDFLTTSLPSSSPTANTVPTSSKKYHSYSESDEVFTTLASDIHKSTMSSTSDSSEAISASTSSESVSSEDTSTSSTTLTSTSSTTASADYLPVVPSFKPNLPPQNVPGYLMLFFKSTFADICETSSALRENLFQYITQRSLRVQSKDQVMMVIDPEHCKEPDHALRIIPVALYVVDDFGSYDKTLIDEMKKLLEEENNYALPIHEIVYHENIAPDNSRVIAAMVITSIAAICFVLLIFLMCTIRNRQKSNYGQRCTPVSTDDYNLDNISEYNNSIRRKGMMRASKRSYGNLAFDDPTGPSKSLTYNGLLKACENRCALDEEFSQIPVVTVKPDELPLGAEVKNRYANVIPLPETRVSLSSTNSCSDSVHDYINANYVKGFKDADKFYIACQAPLSNTIEDFWKMVWKEQTKVIIMLTGLTENGVEKCADYLPPSEVLDCHRLFGDYQITLKKREVKEKYVISSLQLKNMENNLWREVHHLWYTNWPAQGVPNEQSSIIAFLIEARAYMRNTSGPHVVHCCPGTGRTGTVLAIDICIRDYEMTRSVNIPVTVAKLRRCRAGTVQTKEQYAFIYKILALYAKKLNGGAPLDSI